MSPGEWTSVLQLRSQPAGSSARRAVPSPSAFATETSSDWEPLAESEERASPSRPATPGPAVRPYRAGLRDSQHLQWEVSLLGPLPLRGRARA